MTTQRPPPTTRRSASSRSAGWGRSARTCTSSSTATTSSSSTAASCSPTRRCSASTSSSPTSPTSRNAAKRAGIPHHPRPRGPRGRPAVRAAGVPRRARLCVGPRPRPPRQQGQGAQAPQQPAHRAGARGRGPDRAVHRRALPDRAFHPRRHGDRPADAGRDRRAHRRLQVRPHARRRTALGLPHPRQARRGGGDLPALRLHAGGEPRLHALRADRRRSVPRDHGAARRPGHRGHLRQQHRPGPAGPRRRRDVRSQDGRDRALDGAELPDRERPRLPDLQARRHRRQGSAGRHPAEQAGHLHDRCPGGAHGGPRPDGQPRPPVRGDPAGRHGDRLGQPHPGQRGVRRPDHRQPVQGRRQRLLPHDQAGARVGPRQPGRAEADARPDEAASLHPDARRVPDAGPARAPGDRDGRRAGERLHHRERDAHRDPRRRLGAARHARHRRLRLRRRPLGRRRRGDRPA